MFATRNRYALLTSLALAALAGTAIAAPAQAADVTRTSVTVRYQDLNLSSDAGKATLQHRIAKAAEQACAPADPRDFADHARYIACRDAAVADANPLVEAAIAGGDHRFAGGTGLITLR